MRRAGAPSQIRTRTGEDILEVKRQKVDPLHVLTKPFKVPLLSEEDLLYLDEDYDEDGNKQKKKKKTKAKPKDKWNYEIKPRLQPLDPNRFPVFEPKDVGIVLKQKFSMPLINVPISMDPNRAPPALGMRRRANFIPRPLYDPCGEFAIVLYDPTIDHEEEKIEECNEAKSTPEPEPQQPPIQTPPGSNDGPKFRFKKSQKTLAEILGLNIEAPKLTTKVPVLIDPTLAKILRPHQVEGVKFLYRSVTGMIQKGANGCIMADEMGLGKTLQCIALMWTLLKQSPEGSGKGTIDKCIIVCPSSLVRNWANELIKWLGKGTITPFALDGKGIKSGELRPLLKQWANATGRQIVRPVLIVSYDTLRRNVEDLKDAKIGLLLCDEGHRLKNGESQTFTALDTLNVSRRVILSGTPIQNDLSEYFALLSFANPGLLGTRQDFHKNYEMQILRGRDADASDKEAEQGELKLRELSTLVSKFIIRRTNDILSKYLPVKYEHVVFCELSPLQRKLYEYFVSSPEVSHMLRGKGAQPLKGINILKKLCSHPDLLDLEEDIEGCETVLPDDYVLRSRRGRDREVKTWFSGKFAVLERMLARIRADTNDKIVLISNYTQTLDLIETMCRGRRYGCIRLDGSLAINKRQKLVDSFNDPEGSEFIFLLSSKAGGCGINLIGANRLILLDPDWNPASDQQALARVWRDGQKKDCFVYRFIATGTIEEKIFQRQSMKQSLSSCVVDENEDVERLFSLQNLRQLFNLNNTLSETHDNFKCKRCKDGKQLIKAPAMLYGDATTWNHFSRDQMKTIEDLLLRQEAEADTVSFVFQYISH